MLTLPRILAISLFLLSSITQASPRGYAGVDVLYSRLNISDTGFNPILGRLNGGLWLSEGVGIEAMLGGGLKDDDDGHVTMDIPTLSAAYVRFQSPQDFGLKAYILLGYARFEMDGSVSRSNFPGDEVFTGPAASVGMLHPLGAQRRLSLYFELSGYFAHEDLDFGGAALGVRYGY